MDLADALAPLEVGLVVGAAKEPLHPPHERALEPLDLRAMPVQISWVLMESLDKAGVFASALYSKSPVLATALAYAETRRGISNSDSPVYDALLPLVAAERREILRVLKHVFIRNPHWSFYPRCKANMLLYVVEEYDMLVMIHYVKHLLDLYEAAGERCQYARLPSFLLNYHALLANSDAVHIALGSRARRGVVSMRPEQITAVGRWLAEREMCTAGDLRRWLGENGGRTVEIPHWALFRHVVEVPAELEGKSFRDACMSVEADGEGRPVTLLGLFDRDQAMVVNPGPGRSLAGATGLLVLTGQDT